MLQSDLTSSSLGTPLINKVLCINFPTYETKNTTLFYGESAKTAPPWEIVGKDLIPADNCAYFLMQPQIKFILTMLVPK